MGTKRKNKTLHRLIRQYETAKELSSSYVQQLTYAVNRLEKFLGRKARVDDLSTKRINRWLHSENEVGELSDRSRSNLRKNILTLWRFSGRKFKVDKIRNVKVAKKNPQAWTIEQFQQFVDATGQLKGELPNGISKSLYFRTLVWFGLETGLRRRDIWSFDVGGVTDDGRASITQHKTGNSHIVQLSESTVASLKQMSESLRSCGLEWSKPLRWPKSERQFYYWMKRLREISGVDPDVVNRCLQHLRRTGATLIALDGGVAYQYLGHTKPGLDLKSYVDGVKTLRVQLPSFNRDSCKQITLSTAS